MNKIVLVTGASSGIGLEIANYLASKKYIVYGGSRSAPASEHYKVVRLDVTDEVSVQWAIDQIIEQQGRIDVVVNNAGVGSVGAVEKTPIHDIKKSYEVNVFGVVRVCQAVLPHMRRQKSGMIINVSTLGSMVGMPFRAFYSSSKAAMDLVTETLRLEVEPFGIQACTVHPGDIRTNIAEHRIVSTDLDDEAYGKTIKTAFDQMNSTVDRGKDPALFGPYIEKIIESKKIKSNYYVGTFTELLGIKLKNFLPAHLYEKILKSYFKA